MKILKNFQSSGVVIIKFMKRFFQNKEVYNKAQNEWAIDYHHNEYFGKLKLKLDQKYGLLNKRSLFRRITRKIFYKNFIFNILDNIKIKKIFKKLEN